MKIKLVPKKDGIIIFEIFLFVCSQLILGDYMADMKYQVSTYMGLHCCGEICVLLNELINYMWL